MEASPTILCRAPRMPPSTNSTRHLAASYAGCSLCGSPGNYKYYNMDQVVAQALTLCAKLSGATRGELVRKPHTFERTAERGLLRSEAN